MRIFQHTMMRIFQHTIWIARPRETVFDYFTNFSVASEWRSYVRSMTPESPAPVQAGSRINVVMELAGQELRYTLQVLACDRPSLWRHKTDEHDFNGYIEYRFDEENGGTRVTMTGDVRPISFYGWLGIPQILLMRGKSYREQLPQLKRAIEEPR